MLYFLIYNSGLEPISSLSQKVLNHSTMKNDIKRRKKSPENILLDLAVHQSALYNKKKINRGRPDIIHQCIIQYLFSRINYLDNYSSSIKKTKLIIHTIDNNFFEVPHSWRPPTHFLRFRGLMENLLFKKKIKVSDLESIQLQKGNVDDILNLYNIQKLLLFTSHGKLQNLNSLSKKINQLIDEDAITLCLIGGYQHGSIPDNLVKNNNRFSQKESITLPGGRLPSWKIINDIINILEISLN